MYKPRAPRNKYAIGAEVYFHALSDTKDQTTSLFCYGLVVRRPTKDSPVYKIIVTSVSTDSLLRNDNTSLAQQLLGRRIPKKEDEMTAEPTGWCTEHYKTWVDASDKIMSKALRTIEEKRRTKNERFAPNSNRASRKNQQ